MNSYFPTPANACHLMVDIETLATHPTAPILAIGAVLFDPRRMGSFAQLQAEAMLVLIDPADAVNTCGPVDGDTLRWWFRQEDTAIKRLVEPGARSVKDALIELWKYAGGKPTHIWAKSPDFDCAIIASACKAVNIRYPFPFYKQRCVRTAVEMAFPAGNMPTPSGGVKHDARDDAVVQALQVQACYAKLGLSLEPATT